MEPIAAADEHDDEEKKRKHALDYATDEPFDSLVRIGPFKDLLDANLAKAKLNEEGIHAELAGENQAAMLGPIYGAAYGGIHLLVPRRAEMAAREIVTSVEDLRRTRNDAESPLCPYCRHRPSDPVISAVAWLGIGLMAAAILLSGLTPFVFVGLVGGILLLVLPRNPSWKCRTCARRFMAPKPVIELD